MTTSRLTAKLLFLFNAFKRILLYRTPLMLGAVLAVSCYLALRPQQGQAQAGNYVTTFAGAPVAGFADAQGAAARFNAPLGICVDAHDNLIVADFRNARIRKVDPQGKVTTLAGGIQGFANGTGAAARFYGPAGVAIDRNGNIIVADYNNNRIRQLAPNGAVTTIAGSGAYGALNGAGLNARFARPTSVAVDEQNNIYVLDSGTNLVRKIDATRYVSTVAGSYNGYADGQGAAAAFSFTGAAPQACFDAQGNLVIADFHNSVIRSVTPAGAVTTIAGGGAQKDGPAREASFFFATGIARDREGNLIIGDWHNAQVRELDMQQRLVTTIAGSGAEGHADGPALQAMFTRPGGVAVDSKGNIFVSDYFTHTIRRIGPNVPRPSPTPTATPRVTPTPTPIATPSPSPTATPSPSPTVTPSPSPTASPSPSPSPTATPTSGAQLDVIVNPSFESGNTAGWRIQTWAIEGGGALIVTDPALIADGQYALRFQANGRRLADYCAQELSLPPGNYTLSCKVTPSIGTIATLGVQFNDGSPGVTAASPQSQAARLSVNFTVTDGGKPITIYARGNQNRYVRSNFIVDDFRLFKR